MAVVLVALGLAALVRAVVISRWTPRRSAETMSLAAASLGLLVVVSVQDQPAAAGFTLESWVHWTASIVTFGALPIAPARLLRRHHPPPGPGWGRLARLLSFLAGCWFVGFAVGYLVDSMTGLALWQFGGLVERGLARTELILAVTVGAWLCQGCRCSVVTLDQPALSQHLRAWTIRPPRRQSIRSRPVRRVGWLTAPVSCTPLDVSAASAAAPWWPRTRSAPAT